MFSRRGDALPRATEMQGRDVGEMPIPARVHFCWIGPQLSWAYAFALLSAAAQAGMDEVVLHHTDELEEGAVLTALRGTDGLRLERIDARACLAEAGARLGLSDALAALYSNLTSPVQRADVLRAAILYLQGGIYLDLDTSGRAAIRRHGIYRLAALGAQFALLDGLGEAFGAGCAALRLAPVSWWLARLPACGTLVF
jgi:hypothetical protein